jgi:hypothetical protein
MRVLQTTFSVAENRSGRPVSVLKPFSVGPRHWGQFSPAGADRANIEAARVIRVRFMQHLLASPEA